MSLSVGVAVGRTRFRCSERRQSAIRASAAWALLSGASQRRLCAFGVDLALAELKVFTLHLTIIGGRHIDLWAGSVEMLKFCM